MEICLAGDGWGAIAAYNEKYRDKFRIIPQGFRFEVVKTQKFVPNNKKIVFAYAGGITQTGIRSPFHLISYLLTREEVDFEFHIYSNQIETLRVFEARSRGKLILHQSIPRSILLTKLSQMDFLVNLDNGSPTAVPSKLIDYSLSGRPILNITPENPEIGKIDAFLKRDYTHQYIINDPEQYNIVNVAQQFMDLLT